MKRLTRIFPALCVAVAIAAITLAAGGKASAQGFNPQQRSEIEAIIRDYFIKHPEMMEELQQLAQAEKIKRAINEHKEVLLNSPRQVTIGNPNGDVTMVEFFDYNCGYCKRALDDMNTLLKNDPKLRIVLKEMPVLSQGSMEAAQVAAALTMQDKSGKRYLDFHQKLMTSRGAADKAKALAVAKEVGADMPRLEKDMASAEIKLALEESMKLAEAFSIQGTPSYVIGNEVLVGAVGLKELQAKISTARCGKATC